MSLNYERKQVKDITENRDWEVKIPRHKKRCGVPAGRTGKNRKTNAEDESKLNVSPWLRETADREEAGRLSNQDWSLTALKGNGKNGANG